MYYTSIINIKIWNIQKRYERKQGEREGEGEKREKEKVIERKKSKKGRKGWRE